MIWIAWLCLIGAGLLFRRSKLISALIVIFMVLAIGGRTQGADYEIYANEYLWSIQGFYNGVHYLGYLRLEMFAHQYGIEFQSFLLWVAGISSVLYYLGIRRITRNSNIVYALFLLYPFTHEAIQTRTFLADSIILCALPFLLREKETKKRMIADYILFFTLSAIAVSMHFLVTVYIVAAALYITLPKRGSLLKIFIGLIIVYCMIVTNILPKIIEPLNTRVAYWLSSRTGFGVVFPIVFTIGIWILGEYIIRIMRHKGMKYVGNLPLDNVDKFKDYILFLIPMFAYDITFNRAWRLFLVLLYACIAEILYSSRINRAERSSIMFFAAILIVGIFIYEGEPGLITGIFANNAFLG